MTSTFLVEVDHGSDTNLLGIAADLEHILHNDPELIVLSVKPWTHPTLGTAQAPPDVSGQTKQ